MSKGKRQQGTTGNRQQGTGNREQATGNREQATGNRQQGTGNREQASLKVDILKKAIAKLIDSDKAISGEVKAVG